MFFTLAYFTLTGLVSLSVWNEERLLYVRERGAGLYGPGPYLVAKMVADFLPMRLLPASVYAAITYAMVGLRSGPAAMGTYLTILVLTNFTASAIFMCIGIAFRSPTNAQLLGAFCVLTSLMLCGFLLNQASAGPGGTNLLYFSFLYYAYENLVVNEFDGQNFNLQPKGVTDVTIPVTGDLLLAQLGAERKNFAFNFVMLGIIFTAAVVLAYGLLRFCVKEVR